MKVFKQFLASVIMPVLFLGCSSPDNVKPLDPQNMDTSVKASDDFFQYANGTWIESTPIPDDYARYGAFEILIENSWKDVRSILDEAANGSFETGSNMHKIGDLYSSGMDTTKIEEDGLAPLQPYLDKIDAIRDLGDRICAIIITSSIRLLPNNVTGIIQPHYQNIRKFYRE